MERSRTAEFFEARVQEWNEHYSEPDDYWYRRNVLAGAWLAKHLRPGWKSLEIGCATGQLSELLHHRGQIVYGVDISPGMVTAAQTRLGRLGVPFSHFQVCEPGGLPFPDRYFDFVAALDVLPYVENQPQYIREVRRVLKPGGLAFLNNVNRGSLFVSLTTLRVLPSGFGGRYLVPGPSWWRSLGRFIRTGYSSGGFVDLSKAVQARSADALDRMFEENSFTTIGGYDMYNIRYLDSNPVARTGLSAWAARRWAWNHFGLYQARYS